MARSARSTGPSRAGFTYGYQWSKVQPNPWLRFPMDFGSVRLYPVTKKKLGPFNPTGIVLMPEFPTSNHRWHPPHTPEQLVRSYEKGTFDSVDFTRALVALDWHVENGFDLNPFHLSGRPWGVKRFMGRNPPQTWRGNDPVSWMTVLFDFWCPFIKAYFKGPRSLWWLDTELVGNDWPILRDELFGRDEDTAPEDLPHDDLQEEEDFDNEPNIENGDITTEDHQHWYQYGRLYFEGDEAGLVAQMRRDQFWPSVFWISDHGNAHLIELNPLRGN